MFGYIKKLFRKEKQDITQMKYLVAGLGNMHPDYNATRHNIGFEIVDMLAQDQGASFSNENLGDLAMIKHKGRQIYLLKPSTYMNRSGKAVRYWMQKHKIKLENLIVVVDDLNLELGKIRMRAKGSDGGHNGLRDVQETLATPNYARLRFGIGDNFSKGKQVDYVLGKWTPEEIEVLKKRIPVACEAILSFTAIGMTYTMDRFNS